MEHIIHGIVEKGTQLGRKLGFPTANIALGKEAGIKDGVYVVEAEIDGRSYRGMACIGPKPTVSTSGQRFLEVNLFDFDADIYGKPITVKPVKFIRCLEKFNSLPELTAKIEEDRNISLHYFSRNK